MKYKVNKGFITQKLDNKTVIFDSDNSVLYSFNETASYMFSKIKIGWEKEKIIEQIIKQYLVKKERAEKDFIQLVSDLKKKKILA